MNFAKNCGRRVLCLLCRDAAALAQFWVWLEDEIHKGVKLTEVEVSDKLLEFRSKQYGFIDTSFDTISGISCSTILSVLFSTFRV